MNPHSSADNASSTPINSTTIFHSTDSTITPTRAHPSQTHAHTPSTTSTMMHLPEYLPGSVSLIDSLDKRILIVLRDGRHLVGVLKSFDQFMNLMLDKAAERITFNDKYSDFPLGLYIVRGDVIVLLGEIDDDEESRMKLVKCSPEEFLNYRQQEEENVVDNKWEFTED